ncbi:MAG: hypothetical protein GX815_04320 [Clostridiales bacterium]|nr:hypothetical protein [Clostridiales bacterium]
MSYILNTQILETLGTRYATLGVNGYALPVRFRVNGLIVECSVPTWSEVGELLEKVEEVTLVAIKNSETDLSWVFLRGTASLVENQDWEGLVPSERNLVDTEDLYQLLLIYPRRIELFDEQRGWGYRDTADFNA